MRQPFFWALVSSLAFQACNSSDDSKGNSDPLAASYNETPTAAAGTMTQEDAVTFKDGYGTTIVEGALKNLSGTQAAEVGAGGTTAGIPSIGLSLEDDTNTKEGNEDCSAEITAGDDTDADSDFIPDNVTRKIDCTMETDSFKWVAQGSIAWQDNDLEKKPGGFKLTFGPYHAEYTMKAEAHDISYLLDNVGSFETKRDGKTMTSKIEYATQVKAAVASASSETAFGNFFEQTFVADEDADTAEAFFANGILTMNGFFRFVSKGSTQATTLDDAEAPATTAEAPVGWVLKIEGKDLVRKSSCTSGFESGEFTFTDGAGNVMKMTYANCAGTWTYNGTAL